MSALFASVEDLLGEGVDTVARRAAEWGCTELAVSFAYHAARDVTPHGPRRVTVRRDGVSFVPAADAFTGSGLVPAVLQHDADFGPATLGGAAAHGVGVVGWAVFLHNEELGLRHPETTQLSCFGDRAAPADLCPANPRVREYCVELALAVAGLGVREVIAESLHFGAFGHGYHHERDFVGLGALEQFLLGLCFCGYCVKAATDVGVDVSAARTSAVRLVERPFDGIEARLGDTALTPQLLAEAGGIELHNFALARSATVTSLVAEVAAALAARGVRLTFLDLMGAMQGYGDGLPGPASGLDEGWQLGIDIPAIAAHSGVGILAYAQDAERVADETARYRAVLDTADDAEDEVSAEATGDAADDARMLRVLLRPGNPDCSDEANLAAKAAVAQAAGADSVDFYHYGLLPFRVLDRVRGALVGRRRSA
ncbi:hypothetical protein [Glaciibacter psychrotolerans]|uniref:Uncharacterized protein n=1 Tax=Glaciibacter psychrotolerans TaxID=670054 RepID=A0A7Z0EI54_9MICO|nr:hypothetical protein [Leifsonia psychrotolerans]NYJ21302.1 hypothetical protein [Leifsonia psychrotolerans]